MKIIAIAGEPASGKSFIMKGVLERIGFMRLREISKIPCTIVGDKQHVVCLGQYTPGNPFGGTDRFSMSIQPKIVNLLPELEDNFKIVLFEGDRLFNLKFLEIIKEYELEVFWLLASEEAINTRHEKRLDEQSKTWLRGRKTKLKNILLYNDAMGNRYNVRKVFNNTLSQFDDNVKEILRIIADYQ